MSNVVSINRNSRSLVVTTSTTNAMYVGLNLLLTELVGRTRVSFDPKDFNIEFKFEDGVLRVEVHGSNKYGKFILEEIDQQILHEGMSVSTDPEGATMANRAQYMPEEHPHMWSHVLSTSASPTGDVYQCLTCGKLTSTAKDFNNPCIGHKHQWARDKTGFICLVCAEKRTAVSNGMRTEPNLGTLEHGWEYLGPASSDTFQCRYCNATTNSINPTSVCSGSAISYP